LSAVILRRLPRETVVHRLGVTTKLASLSVLTVALLINPRWSQIAATAVFTAMATVITRVPRSAVPRIPPWFWFLQFVGLGLAYAGGGWSNYLEVLTISALFGILSMLVAWTTTPADIAPALLAVGRPLRRFGVPVDEWVITTALCIRSLPLLIDELRVMVAARRLRPWPDPRRPATVVLTVVDALTAAMAVTLRRASDMGEAITARGGAAEAGTEKAKLSWPDGVAVVIVLAVSAVPFLL
jgi:energy-coupling factor transport system permease protein